jgi:hypothetical protein
MRSCDDVDQTALSYAEIKALCAGNPLIAEKMNLDVEVAKLRMLKSEHQSQHYRLEDSLLKRFPAQIADVTERITGIETDVAGFAEQKEKCLEIRIVDGASSASMKFPGMTINGVAYTEKEPAAKALLETTKKVTSKADIPVGEYMGFQMSLHLSDFGRELSVLLRGEMTYSVNLGTDVFGNITRINNALDELHKRLEGAKSQFENLVNQQEAARLELEKPFPLEAELHEKETRLALLNAGLNIEGDGGFDVMNDPDNRDGMSEEQNGNSLTAIAAGDGDFDEDSEDYDDETESPAQPLVSGNQAEVDGYSGIKDDQIQTCTYGKAKPSFLDGLRSFNSGGHNNVTNGGKSAGLII